MKWWHHCIEMIPVVWGEHTQRAVHLWNEIESVVLSLHPSLSSIIQYTDIQFNLIQFNLNCKLNWVVVVAVTLFLFSTILGLIIVSTFQIYFVDFYSYFFTCKFLFWWFDCDDYMTWRENKQNSANSIIFFIHNKTINTTLIK